MEIINAMSECRHSLDFSATIPFFHLALDLLHQHESRIIPTAIQTRRLLPSMTSPHSLCSSSPLSLVHDFPPLCTALTDKKCVIIPNSIPLSHTAEECAQIQTSKVVPVVDIQSTTQAILGNQKPPDIMSDNFHFYQGMEF